MAETEFHANPNLVNKQAANAAYRGTSFDPEKRAEQAIQGFASEVQSMYERLKPYATSESQKATLISEMQRFQTAYAQKYNDLLYSHSRLYSTMIAGPSKFPAERMRKLNEAYDWKADEVIEWKNRAEKSILRTLKGEAIEEAGGEIEVLKKKIADAERNHEFMVKANVVVRKKIPDDQKVKEIMALGTISETTAREILKPDPMGRVGFPAYALSNDTANIHRMKERLIELGKKEATTTSEIAFTGGNIIDNKEMDRVQIIFDQKPPESILSKLRGEGWRWSPSNTAWQRKRTPQALQSAMRITGAGATQLPTQGTPPHTTIPTNNIITLAKLRASEWFKAQVSNPYERYYLYHRVGDFRISNIDLPGYTLSNTERIPTSWTVEQATQWVINTVQKLPILPLEAVPVGAPVAQPAKYKLGQMVYSYQNPTIAAPIIAIHLSDDPLYAHTYILRIPGREGIGTRNSNNINEESLSEIPLEPQKEQGVKKMYRYYYRNRPPSIGTQPAGFISTEAWLPTRITPHRHTAFGWVEYDRPLTTEEISSYELFEDEMTLPKLVAELVQFASGEGIDEAMKEVDSEYGKAVLDWLRSERRIRAGIGQKEQIRDEIMRLAGISAAAPAPITVPTPIPAAPPVVKTGKPPEETQRDIVFRIQDAKTVGELQEIKNEIPFLPITPDDKNKIIQQLNRREVTIRGEMPFGAPVTLPPTKPVVFGAMTTQQRSEAESRRKADMERKSKAQKTIPSTSRRLFEFGVEEDRRGYYAYPRF